MSDQPCQFDFTNSTRTVIVCKAHGEREVLRPSTRAAILSDLAKAGKWAGPALSLPEASALPMTAPGANTAMIEYHTPDGQTVALSVFLFQQMLCPNANDAQARYMLGWCQHNRIDPFGNEAYFSIIDGKPVIQVSKDCWFRRMERHPAFVSHDSGILVETDLPAIRDAVIVGFCPYLVSEELKQRILADFLNGAITDAGVLPASLVLRKRGQFLGEKDTLLGGWAEIQRTDRPLPYTFQIDLKGWETTKSNGDLNHFWTEKPAFMIWKSALKNCARLAFPELSGLIAQPERDLDPAAIADAEFTAPNSTEQKRKLFALGRDIPPPLGPLAYEQLHALAEAFFEGKGISELTMFEMAGFLDKIELAVGGDPRSLGEIRSHLLSTGDVSTPDLTLTKHRER